MHRCFHIPEVVYLLCDELNEDGPFNSIGKSDLRTLARTCRAFHDPALDHLWRELTSFIPLIKCMPSDLWETSKTEEGEEILSFKRPIVPSDWPRLLTYARRVHVFKYYGNYLKDTADYLVFSLAAGSQTLLPNMQDLAWYTNSESLFMIHSFLGPKIKKISLSLSGPEIITHSLIENLSIRHPSLTHVDLSGSHANFQVISSAVKNWDQLQALTIKNLTGDALKHLATLPDLRILKLLGIQKDPILVEPVEQQCSPSFLSLQTLIILSQNIEFCINIVKLITFSPCLKTITISSRYGMPTPPSVWIRVFGALQAHCKSSSLTTLSLGDKVKLLGPENDPGLISAHQVAPLLLFPNLTYLNLVPCGGIDLDNSLLKKMAMAWPCMKNLQISDRLEHAASRVTLSGLAPLAKFCPRLSSLYIYFDGTLNEFSTKRPSDGTCNEELRTLGVLDSPIGSRSDIYSLAATASFLSDIFPNLTMIHLRSNTEREKAWADVGKLVKAFSATRKQERALTPGGEDDNSGEGSLRRDVVNAEIS